MINIITQFSKRIRYQDPGLQLEPCYNFSRNILLKAILKGNVKYTSEAEENIFLKSESCFSSPPPEYFWKTNNANFKSSFTFDIRWLMAFPFHLLGIVLVLVSS